MADQWDYYRAALQGLEPDAPADRTKFPSGYYRTIKHEPLGVWEQDGERYVMLGAGEKRTILSRDRESYLAESGPGRAITKELYIAVAYKGELWPDQDAVTAQQQAATSDRKVRPNAPPDQDEAAILAEQIENASKIDDYKVITDDATLTKALSRRNRLQELRRQADAKRVELKAPHLKAGREIDEKWGPLVRAADVAATALNRVMSAFETRRAREQREQAEKEVIEQRRAEAAAAEQDIALAHTAPTPTPIQAPVAPRQIAPAYGPKTTPKTVRVITAVTDYGKLFWYFAEHEDVRQFLRDKAQKAVNAGAAEVPGCTIEDEVRVGKVA